jgi:hypothetical protein
MKFALCLGVCLGVIMFQSSSVVAAYINNSNGLIQAGGFRLSQLRNVKRSNVFQERSFLSARKLGIMCLQNRPPKQDEIKKANRLSWEIIAIAMFGFYASFSGNNSLASNLDRGAVIFQNSCSKCHAGMCISTIAYLKLIMKILGVGGLLPRKS